MLNQQPKADKIKTDQWQEKNKRDRPTRQPPTNPVKVRSCGHFLVSAKPVI